MLSLPLPSYAFPAPPILCFPCHSRLMLSLSLPSYAIPAPPIFSFPCHSRQTLSLPLIPGTAGTAPNAVQSRLRPVLIRRVSGCLGSVSSTLH
eukprot:350211-Chlamydomonas_euryale.AAC.1